MMDTAPHDATPSPAEGKRVRLATIVPRDHIEANVPVAERVRIRKSLHEQVALPGSAAALS